MCGLTLSAEKCGKSVPFVMAAQKKFELPVLKEYSAGYAVLLTKLIYLSACAVPQKEINTLLSRERKLLELLKVPLPMGFVDIMILLAGCFTGSRRPAV